MNPSDLFEVQFQETSYVCIETDAAVQYGIVGVKSAIFYCFTCRKNHCCHTSAFKSVVENEPDCPDFVGKLINQTEESLGKSKKNIRGPKVFSRLKIPFERDETVTAVMSDHLQSVSKNSDGTLMLVPFEEKCQCGSPLSADDPVHQGWIAYGGSPVITNSKIFYADGLFTLNSYFSRLSNFERFLIEKF